MSDSGQDPVISVLPATLAPMLAEPVEDEKAIKILEANTHRVEQKLDGVRLLVHVQDGKTYGINRKGARTIVHPLIAKGFVRCTGEWVFDGELVGGIYWVFDMPAANGIVVPTMEYGVRRQVLDSLWPKLEMPDTVQLLPSYQGTPGLDLAIKVRKSGGEGLMLKDPSAPYRWGKRTLGVLKFKFWKTLDCMVIEPWREGKASVSVGLIDQDTAEIIDIGSVKMTEANLNAIEQGDVVEVRYLYANDPAEPRLYQPDFLRLRTDKALEECTLDQLDFTNKTVIKED